MLVCLQLFGNLFLFVFCGSISITELRHGGDIMGFAQDRVLDYIQLSIDIRFDVKTRE